MSRILKTSPLSAWFTSWIRSCADSGGLPMVAQLLIQNCSQLVDSQRAVLGRLALAGSSRTNAGVFSLYDTQLGGQTLLPGLTLPRYRVLTLGGAGQLVILRASRDEG